VHVYVFALGSGNNQPKDEYGGDMKSNKKG
jgi:hypothetical protein